MQTLLKIIFFILTVFLTLTYSKTLSPDIPNLVDDTFHLYLSPEGNDTNSGTVPYRPLLTLQKAHDTMQKELHMHNRNAIIHIKNGLYLKQKTNWDFTMPHHTITLKGDEQIPVFDGMGMKYPWLRVPAHPGSSHNNLHIIGLQIQHYNNAILFKGDKNDWRKDVSHNSVKDCRFINIGDKYSTAPIGYAAISLVNSRHNLFEKNTFINIINHKTTCKENANKRKCFPTDTFIHAFYLSSYSSKNIIQSNTFSSISGDAIKVRDFCNLNLITHNRFENVRRVYQDWYNSYRNVKEEDHVECYSWGNIIKNNLIGLEYQTNKKAPLTDIKTKFIINSKQENQCQTAIFKDYHIDKYAQSSQIHDQNRTVTFDNLWSK